MGVSRTIFLGLPQTTILPVLPSQPNSSLVPQVSVGRGTGGESLGDTILSPTTDVMGRVAQESHLLLAAATHTPPIGFSSHQLHLDGLFQGHHGFCWGFGEPSGLWPWKMRSSESVQALEALPPPPVAWPIFPFVQEWSDRLLRKAVQCHPARRPPHQDTLCTLTFREKGFHDSGFRVQLPSFNLALI
jgi:hypothetical protein